MPIIQARCLEPAFLKTVNLALLSDPSVGAILSDAIISVDYIVGVPTPSPSASTRSASGVGGATGDKNVEDPYTGAAAVSGYVITGIAAMIGAIITTIVKRFDKNMCANKIEPEENHQSTAAPSNVQKKVVEDPA